MVLFLQIFCWENQWVACIAVQDARTASFLDVLHGNEDFIIIPHHHARICKHLFIFAFFNWFQIIRALFARRFLKWAHNVLVWRQVLEVLGQLLVRKRHYFFLACLNHHSGSSLLQVWCLWFLLRLSKRQIRELRPIIFNVIIGAIWNLIATCWCKLVSGR